MYSWMGLFIWLIGYTHRSGAMRPGHMSFVYPDGSIYHAKPDFI